MFRVLMTEEEWSPSPFGEGWGEAFFSVFAAVTAEFWHKTVMYLRAVRKARFQAQTEKTARWVV